jgi:hypothetical protein
MLDRLSKFTPQLSILALVLVSVFNIGYFFRIGIHFLGLMDLSNIVYSMAITYVGLLGGLQVVMLALFQGEKLFAHEKASEVYSLFTKIFVVPLLIAFAILVILLAIETIPTWLGAYSDKIMLGASVFLVAYSGVGDMIGYYKKRRKFSDERTLATFYFLLFAVSCAGRVEASYLAFGTDHYYRVTDKHGVDSVVRIVRSSSSGFLVSKDGKIMFIPKDEVSRVATEFDPRTSKNMM